MAAPVLCVFVNTCVCMNKCEVLLLHSQAEIVLEGGNFLLLKSVLLDEHISIFGVISVFLLC